MLSESLKSKLVWRCRRGMLELDLMLEKFLEKNMNTLTESDYDRLEVFLANPDPDLYAWLMGYESPVDAESRDVVAFIQSANSI